MLLVFVVDGQRYESDHPHEDPFVEMDRLIAMPLHGVQRAHFEVDDECLGRMEAAALSDPRIEVIVRFDGIAYYRRIPICQKEPV